MEWKIYAENEPADYASDFFYKKIAAYPIVETDVESPQIKHRISDRLYENDRILSLPGRAGLWASPDTGQGTKFFYSETRKKMTFHEEPDKNEAQDIPNGRRLFRQLWGRPKTNYRNTDRNVRCDTYNVVCFRRINLLHWPVKRNQIEILWEP